MLTRKRLSIVSEMLPVREMDKIQLDLIHNRYIRNIRSNDITYKKGIHSLLLILVAITCAFMMSSRFETVCRIDGSHVELDELIQQLPSPSGTLWCNVYYSSGRGATYNAESYSEQT